MTEEKLAEILERNRRYFEELDRKHGGPPPPLTEEEMDRSETEIHNWLRRGPPEDESDG